jgi:hypothetical protein
MPSRRTQQGREFVSKPRWIAWFCFLASLLGLLVGLMYGYYDILYELLTHGVARGISTAFFYGATAIFLLAISAGFLISLLTQKRTRVMVTTEQIRVGRGNEIHTLILDAITQLDLQQQVTYYLFVPVQRQLIRISTSKQSIMLYSSMGKFHQLVDVLSEGIYPRIFSRTMQAIHTGQSVTFGEITISRDGIIHRRRLYLWGELKGSVLIKEELHIQMAGIKEENIRIPICEIPNLPVVIRILNDFTQPILK